MTPIADAFAGAAERLIGARFLLHGRSPETGVDCVGLVAYALSEARNEACDIPNYSLRNLGYDFIPDFAARNDLYDATGPLLRGDILVVQPGPAQRHILVALGRDRFVHAHAGLRRVTAVPGPLDWPILHQFRIQERL